MSDEIELENIEKGETVRAYLPLKDSTEKFRSNCTYTFIKKNTFSLTFQKDELPIESLVIHKSAIITINQKGVPASIEATVTEIKSNTEVVLQMLTAFTHDQLREFFRVDAVTTVITNNFHSSFSKKKDSDWSVQGETLDISGSGILAIFPSRIPDEELINLKIELPTENKEIISITAKQVRTSKLGDDRWEVALQYDNIKTEDRDKIIGCCLTIQRKLLQLKVRTRS